MKTTVEDSYRRYRKRNCLFILSILILTLFVVIIALCLGATNVGWKDLKSILDGNATSGVWQIVMNLRLPRIVSALICGWALALSGCIMQILLRNPLASPYTLGLSNAAAFGASLAIVFGGAASSVPKSGDMALVVNPYIVTISAFICSILALCIILLIAKRLNGSTQTIILSGVIISSIFGAALSGIQYIASSTQLASIIFWSFGELGHTEWFDILLIIAVIIPVSCILYYNRWSYRAVSAGDEYAASLGVNPNRTRLIGMILATLCTAMVVSFFGVIAFIGLVVPHMIRLCIGNNEEFLIPASAIFGAVFLLICDTVARTVLAPIIIPVGIITSLVGAPFFLMLLLRRQNNEIGS